MMTDLTKVLQVGQIVRLEEAGWGYEIAVLLPEETGLKVVAVATDCVVIEDEVEGIKRRIPGHLIKQAATPAPLVTQAA
jgi:hypothetical protein